jgi:hypothetical protein
MKTYIKLTIGALCLALVLLGTTQAQAVSKTDKNFNSDIYKIQKILATDSSIYPEGKLTGVLDAPTSAAIKRFSELYYKASNLSMLAQQAGLESKIKSDVNNLRAFAEIYYDQNGNSYKGFCKSVHFNNVKNDLKQYKSIVTCADESGYFQVNTNLPGTKNYHCADSTGLATTMSKKPKKGSLACQ